MWLAWFLLTVFAVKSGLSIADPGILRIPKVYNAVITSNQNLAPSRAYPVIQPVVHKTAIGYVPPFYYTRIVPDLAGPGVVQLDPGAPSRPEDAESVEAPDSPDSEKNSSPRRISRPGNNDEEFSDETSSENPDKGSSTSSANGNKKKPTNDRVPLNFYPNYRSVYYDPYFNPYNIFPPNLATPGTYYVDYPRPPGILGPLPPPLPLQPGPGVFAISPGGPGTTADGGNDGESGKRRSERQKSRMTERREKMRNPEDSKVSVGKNS